MVEKLPVIIGLDALGGDNDKVSRLVEDTCEYASGFKVGLPNILGGLNPRSSIIEKCSRGLVIADLKLADISDTMIRIASHTLSWANAVIAHAFPGYKGALDGLSRHLEREGVKLILVLSMSNPGSMETMDPIIDKLLWIAEVTRAWGVVAPATRPNIIKYIRGKIKNAVILSPGIGAQGATPGTGIRAGADFEIIGRLVTMSKNPRGTLRSLKPLYKVKTPSMP